MVMGINFYELIIKSQQVLLEKQKKVIKAQRKEIENLENKNNELLKKYKLKQRVYN